MSFLNGAHLCISFKPATSKEVRAINHAHRMAAKQARSPSRAFVTATLTQWRVASGYYPDAPIHPQGWDDFDLTAQVKACHTLV